MSHENQVLKVPSLSDIKDSVAGFVNTRLNRLEKNVGRSVFDPVNNYLKTPEEIEADFSQQVNFQGITMSMEISGSQVRIIEHKDGYINIHDPHSINQGFMEENY